MSGIALLVAFAISIIVMIVLISRFDVHPFLAILAVSLVLGLLGGIPLNDTTLADGSVQKGIATIIGEGFSSTFTSIGIVIIFGTLIGTILESTGAALKLADMVINMVGEKRPSLAIEIMGWVVSIPVFCDSGFVILNPIRKAMVKRTGASSVAMSVCLSAGLYAAHVFVPPTPGPIAAASTLGIGNQLLLVIGLGVLVSIPALVAGYLYAGHIGKKIKSKDEIQMEESSQTYEELKASYGQLPSGASSISPIIVPIILMALANIANISGWDNALGQILTFLGVPIIALAVGVILSIVQLGQTGRLEKLYDLTTKSLKTAGPILFVTAAGGVLGKIISSTSLVDFIASNATSLKSIGIFFPFIIAAIIKTSQGSSTVAITTTAGILAPILPALGMGTDLGAALCVMAIGAGAMTVSHANDSYFWVVTNFGQMTTEEGYKTQTMSTLITGLTSIVFIWILSLILL